MLVSDSLNKFLKEKLPKSLPLEISPKSKKNYFYHFSQNLFLEKFFFTNSPNLFFPLSLTKTLFSSNKIFINFPSTQFLSIIMEQRKRRHRIPPLFFIDSINFDPSFSDLKTKESFL